MNSTHARGIKTKIKRKLIIILIELNELFFLFNKILAVNYDISFITVVQYVIFAS